MDHADQVRVMVDLQRQHEAIRCDDARNEVFSAGKMDDIKYRYD